jgi:hypothetical protein
VDKDSLSSRITWQAPAAGAYHVLVRAYDGSVYGDDTGYVLEIEDQGLGIGY